MKKHIIILISLICSVYSILCQERNDRFIQIYSNGEYRSVFLSEIDSITYSQNNGVYSQQIWMNNKQFENGVNGIDTISFNSLNDIRCAEYHDEYVQYGVIANTGDFLFILNPEKTNNKIVLTAGNSNDLNNSIFCQADSFGIIRNMYVDNRCYAMFYGEDSISIISDDSIVIKAPYSIFEQPDDYQLNKGRFRAGGITDSWWFQSISVLKTLWDLVDGKGVASRVTLYGGLKIVDFLDPEGADLRRMTMDGETKDLIDLFLLLLEKLDGWIDKLTFGDMSIETLDPEKKEVTKYTIGCKINYSTTDNLYSDYPHSYRITMKIDSKDRHWTEEKNDFSSDGTVKFDLQGLEYKTDYSYQPRLDIVVYNPYLNDFVTVAEMLRRSGLKGYDFGNIPPHTTRYLVGETKGFKTGYPSCRTGEVVSVTDKSAVVKCSYSDVGSDMNCGIMVSDDRGTKKRQTTIKDGERSISILGLRPATTYNYWAYVEVDGVPENGEVKSFTTKFPDLSGTWIFDQSIFGQKTLYINLVYNSSGNGYVTYDAKPGFYGVNSLSVTFYANRTIAIVTGGPAGYRSYCSGEINDDFTSAHGNSYQFATPNTVREIEEPWTFSR